MKNTACPAMIEADTLKKELDKENIPLSKKLELEIKLDH